MQLSRKGYSFLKENNEELVEYFKKYLTVKPKVNPESPNSENVTEFPVYKENSKRFYIPKALGLKLYGSPREELNILKDGIICDRLIFNGELRPHQNEPVRLFLEASEDPARLGGIISLFCGEGKTLCALYIICKLKRKALVVCHKSFLIDQWKERIQEFIPTAKIGLIKAQITQVEDCDIVIGSLQSIAMKDYDKKIFEDFHISVFDECFPYKQHIVTEDGPYKIGYIYHKWIKREYIPRVLSYNKKTNNFEYKNITYAWESKNNKLLKISFSKSYIKCTYNHKILTNNGYIEAINLSSKDLIVCNNTDNTICLIEIISIEMIDNEDLNLDRVYDIEVEDNHNFICTNYEDNDVRPIVHNCHHLSAEVFSRALHKCTTKVMLGLSATLNRSDGLRKVFEWFIGPPVYESKKRTDTDMIIKMINYYDTHDKYGRELYMYNGKRNIAAMISALCDYELRTAIIVQQLKIILHKEPDRKTIIISDRINHLKMIEKELLIQFSPNKKTISYYIGGMSQVELKKSESADIMLGTYKMIAEGFDVPSLNTLILASPISAVEQSIGRIQRQKQCDRKYTPYVIDIWDNYSLFKNQGFTRYKFYKKNGYEIKVEHINTPIIEFQENNNKKNSKNDKKIKIIDDD